MDKSGASRELLAVRGIRAFPAAAAAVPDRLTQRRRTTGRLEKSQ